MISDEIRTELQNIVRGISGEKQGDSISSIRNHLIQSFGPSRTSQKDFESKSVIKKEQEQFLKEYCQKNNLLFDNLTTEYTFLAQGGESSVYLSQDGKRVVKINNARYYATWTEYFTSLAIHNLIFPSTEYSLIGFMNDSAVPEDESPFSLVVSQTYIEGEQISLEKIEEILAFNGFKIQKRQDYYNDEFGIALEDMHDENVLRSDGLPFFVDTVFYVMDL